MNCVIVNDEKCKNIIEDINKSSECVVTFDDSIQEDTLFKCLDILTANENANGKNLQYKIKQLNFNLKLNIIKYFLINDNYQNDNAILNIVNLIKSYNSLSDNFFNNENIWFNSVTEFLDAKLSLKDQIKQFITKISIWYFSLISSVHKIEPNFLDKIVDIPLVFKKIFMSFEIFTISGIISKANFFETSELKVVNDAFPILNMLMMKSAITNSFVNSILEKFNVC